MKITKAQWTAEGDTVRLSMPLTKVDKENRLVSGWASLDNDDTQGDIVEAAASAKAFKRFRGNIREMHQPIAVGRMVDFKEDQFFDEKTQKFYNGIYATVYVSKGAQDTWEKVLDGTLQGFSIGGNILDATNEFDKAAGKPVRIVKDYELVELSLVDSPANQLANIFSIEKAASGTMTVTGTITDKSSENVFYCTSDQIAKTSDGESLDCGICGKSMENIGWFEYDSDDEKATKVAEVLAKYNSSNTDNAEQELPATTEGGVNVAEENETVEKSEGVVPGSAAPAENESGAAGVVESEAASSNEAVVENAEEGKADEAAEEVPADESDSTEKAADVSEVEVEKPDFAKMFGDLQAAITGGLEKNSTEAQEAIAKAAESFEAKVSELATQYAELTTKFDSLKDELTTVEKAVAVVESETAFKKSGDLGGSTEDTLSKSKGSKWGGFFLGTNAIEND